MPTERRPRPYIWCSWLPSYLHGDAHCLWRIWFQAHHTFDRVPPSGDLAQWNAEHAEMVRARAEALRAAGWPDVRVEDQNKFHVNGPAALVGGKPDIIAIRDDEARIEDCKTGAQREAHRWQVITYAVLLGEGELKGKRMTGAVIYRNGIHEVDASDIWRGAPMVIARIRATAASEEPRRTPSASECRFCPIAACPERVTQAAAAISTSLF